MPPKAGRNTNHKAPTFTLECGVVLELKKVSQLLYERYEYEYRRDHPEPTPPVAILSTGERQTLSGDEFYKEQHAKWQSLFYGAIGEWVFNCGIVTAPPDDWRNTTGVFKDNPRLAWVYSIISTEPSQDEGESESVRLMNAIVGLSIPTEAAIEAAQKN